MPSITTSLIAASARMISGGKRTRVQGVELRKVRFDHRNAWVRRPRFEPLRWGQLRVDAVPAGQARDRDDEALAALYRLHYKRLVRYAGSLLSDTEAAEDVVQDSFVAVHGAWQHLRDGDKAVYYLRSTVINRSRSMLRHRAMVARHTPPVAPLQMPSAEEQALARWECKRVAAALQMLAPRQRQALVLRYYADLPEAQIAATMGLCTGTVKAHLWRARESLRVLL